MNVVLKWLDQFHDFVVRCAADEDGVFVLINAAIAVMFGIAAFAVVPSGHLSLFGLFIVLLVVFFQLARQYYWRMDADNTVERLKTIKDLKEEAKNGPESDLGTGQP